MKISIGSDHRGYELKKFLMQSLTNIEWLDRGAFSQERVDYPVYAKKVCNDILSGQTERGILICGSGIGMSIAANRHKGIFAALCWNVEVARASRQDDNANILVLPANFVSDQEALALCKEWMLTPFKGDRYEKRLLQIDSD
ncbi:MAG: RpiB/LacA/LacB family sugar-phosphate isomerase [bacterium]